MSSEVKEVKKGKFKDTIDSLVVAFVIAMIIRAFIIQAYKIPSGSMLNTLLIGDHILVNKLAYKFGKPKRGDIIVFEWPVEPEKDFIKRVIATPGDKFQLINKKVYINDKPLNEPYAIYKSSFILPGNFTPRDNTESFIIPKGYYFVMGDNRDSSYDSRYWGFVSEDKIKGKAWIIYWSWDFRDGFKLRLNRVLKVIH
ncbi:signal peptidase I [Deferribacter desulfuricans SSM1]|uniref:Signal peptidase I n=1 Tax=Deferribacter desulfuricans (strain DSM 14783 / JCM 11476 / NBRC 101012 / SSM1) TaxID=639282 RepID=D3PAK6_DEFDS|nr:signal peptidase I [Deferribacter desulfuricans]BAI79629.1 signal peptidase I [Deferribacter desulfuricans SSM1]